MELELLLSVDSTGVRAYQHAAGAPKLYPIQTTQGAGASYTG